jgi:hypothetical protein
VLLVEFRHHDATDLMLNWYQYSETSVMHFLFNLFNNLYMYRALLAHLQEALYKRHFVYCLRVMSVGYTRIDAAN